MAFQRILWLFFVFITVSFSSSHARRFYVGNRDGWVLHPSEKYNQWAGRNRFLVNDTLHFKYDKKEDSVLEVSKDDYDHCNTENPIAKFEDGDSEFTLRRSGPFFFISGNKDHCQKGQKLIVVVLSERHRLPAPATPLPPSSHPPAAASPKEQPPTSPYPGPETAPPKAASPAPVVETPKGATPVPATSLAPQRHISPASPSPSSHPPAAAPPKSPTPISPSPANAPAASPTASAPQLTTPATSPTAPTPHAISPSFTTLPAAPALMPPASPVPTSPPSFGPSAAIQASPPPSAAGRGVTATISVVLPVTLAFMGI